tara:strand:- start:658 stop:1257 length:600 start_codon:yes stop_codon:yes gene_type:complete
VIGIVDYNMGNVGSIESMLHHLGYVDTLMVTSPEQLNLVDKIILPGVGSFDTAIRILKESGLFSELTNQVIEKRKPILGICLGMQLLMDGSEEGRYDGLGWVKGKCKKFHFDDKKTKVPHMGWNQTNVIKNGLVSGESRFYYVHSYFVECVNKEDIMLETTYKNTFISGVSKGNIYGVQFHPEKSHKYGMELFKNFIKL